MRKALICVLVAICSMAAIAQQPASASATSSAGSQPLPPNAASREKVLQLLNLIDIKKTTDIAMRTAIQQIKANAMQSIQQEVPTSTPEEMKRFNDLIDGVTQDTLGSLHIDEMIEVIVPVYQRHFTDADLDAVLAFYSSPTGQKFLNETPQILQETMAAMGPLQQKMMQEMMQKMQQRMEKLMEEEKKGRNSNTAAKPTRN